MTRFTVGTTPVQIDPGTASSLLIVNNSTTGTVLVGPGGHPLRPGRSAAVLRDSGVATFAVTEGDTLTVDVTVTGTFPSPAVVPAANPSYPSENLIGTAAQWAAHDLVLDRGQEGIQTGTPGTELVKIGDGVTRFSQLPSAGGGGGGYLTTAAATGTYGRRYTPPSVVCLGDSQTQGTLTTGMNYPAVLAALSGRRLAVTNKGVSGNTSAQMLARVATDVLALSPSACLFLGPTNDIATSVPLATTQANIGAIAAVCNGQGIEFIPCTIPPRNQHTGGVGAAYVRDFNNWLRLWSQANGYRLIDVNAVLVDPRKGEYLSTLNVDVVHPNAAGILLMAQAAAAVLLNDPSKMAPFRSASPIECEIDYVASMPATVPYSAQLVYNPLMYDLDANGQPDYWTETPAAGVTRSVVTDTRFVANALKLACAANNAGYLQAFTLPAGTWAVGDKLRLTAKMALDSPSGFGANAGIEIRLAFTGPGTTTAAVTQWSYVTPAGQAPEFSVDAVVPATTTTVKVEIAVNCGGGSGTFYVGQVGALNLTTLGLASTALTA